MKKDLTLNELKSDLGALFIAVMTRASWAPLLVLGLHYVLGDHFGHEPYVDPIMHFSGGVAAAYFFYCACQICAPIIGYLKPIGLKLAALALTATIAVFWEIGEFISDVGIGTNTQLSNANTMRDLILGVVGGIVFVILTRGRSAPLRNITTTPQNGRGDASRDEPNL